MKHIPLLKEDRVRLERLGFISDDFERLEGGGLISTDSTLNGSCMVDESSIVSNSYLSDAILKNSIVEASTIIKSDLNVSYVSESDIKGASLNEARTLRTSTDANIINSSVNTAILRGSPITASSVECVAAYNAEIEYSKIRYPKDELTSLQSEVVRDDSHKMSPTDLKLLHLGYIVYGDEDVTILRGEWNYESEGVQLTKDKIFGYSDDITLPYDLILEKQKEMNLTINLDDLNSLEMEMEL